MHAPQKPNVEDGVITDVEIFNTLSPVQVESITVIKDDSATFFFRSQKLDINLN